MIKYPYSQVLFESVPISLRQQFNWVFLTSFLTKYWQGIGLYLGKKL